MTELDYNYFQKQIELPSLYTCYGRGEGMYECTLTGNYVEKYLVNTRTKMVYKLVDFGGNVKAFTNDDVDYESVDKMENAGNAHTLVAHYHFSVGGFEDGVAMVTWTLFPDGRYFADEDGFGMEDNDETTIYAFIDTNCEVLIPFQDMDDRKYMKACQERAKEMVKKRNA